MVAALLALMYLLKALEAAILCCLEEIKGSHSVFRHFRIFQW
jgi:hypothetical protein